MSTAEKLKKKNKKDKVKPSNAQECDPMENPSVTFTVNEGNTTRAPTQDNDSNDSVQGQSLTSSETQLESKISLKSEENCRYAPPDLNEAHAYVPYLYARDSIAKIMADMKKMKTHHILLVNQIELNYKTIEDETQGQFNTFVSNLGQSYGRKTKTFRQVIDLHRMELQQKQEYWDEALCSLSARNKQLLNDKKNLLIRNKVDFDHLEADKEMKMKDVWLRLEETMKELEICKHTHQNEISILKTECEEEKKKEIDEIKKALYHEIKVLQDSLKSQNPEKVSDLYFTATVDSSHPGTSSREIQNNVKLGPTVVITDLSENEMHRMEEERRRMKDEREQMRTERQDMEREMNKFSEEKKSFQLQINDLKQHNIIVAKNCDVWKAKYDTQKDLLEQLSNIKKKYDLLRAKFDAAVAVASINTDVERKIAEEKLMKAENDKLMIEDEREQLEKDIQNWRQLFYKQHDRYPEESDRLDSVKEFYHSRDEADLMAAKLNGEITTIQSLMRGDTPKPTDIEPEIVRLAEPEVKIIEVKIPDNSLQAELDMSLVELLALRQQIVTLKSDVAKEKNETALVMTELGDVQHQVTQLTAVKMELEKQLAGTLNEQHVTVPTMNDDFNSQSEKRTDAELTLEAAQVELDALRSQIKAMEEELISKQEAVDEKEVELGEKDEEVRIKERQYGECLLAKEKLIKDMEKDIRKLLKHMAKLKAKLGEEKEVESDKELERLEDRITDLEKHILDLQEDNDNLQKDKAGLENKNMNHEKKIIKLKEEMQTLKEQYRKNSSATSTKPVTRENQKSGDAKAVKVLNDKLGDAKQENNELISKLHQLENELKRSGTGSDIETSRQMKKQEKVLRELEKILDMEKKKNQKNELNITKLDQELKDARKEIKDKDNELKKLHAQLAILGTSAEEAALMSKEIKKLKTENKKLTDEAKVLTENFNSERVLRKKYYNMVEDMKGKIRVYCRVRPLSKDENSRGNKDITKSVDEYTISVNSNRGLKDFQFDTVFMPNSTQEKVFEDTNNLVQSAVDGYNVCIFAYGQTGSGKTFTIIGDQEQRMPGIAPRAFNRIFELLDENRSKYSCHVSCYMLELYNDKLLDLFCKSSTNGGEDKLDIKKDKKGMVIIQGAEVKHARNAKELLALFEEGSKTRHTASTKMNAESSRSHLVIGIIIETTNKSTGQLLKGKLSLVDLAGSERAAKTDASAEQLKEAMSINKSLSALGDVISALSSEQQFIPYRNNKLTMLMQDSLGGNAKTLMFVNISPADYNSDESVVSLTYASRVKLITNDAQKNSDSKEISKLKTLIAKMKKGETVLNDEDEDSK